MQGFSVVMAMIGTLVVLAWLALRQARSVRDQAYRKSKAPRAEQPWQESLTEQDGLVLSRDASHSEELLAMGEEARRHRWSITHQS